jgi:hypothetical protein
MKANELRIGNLFWFTDFHARKERVICGADIAYAEKEPDWLDAFWTPIPLTEEWLIRFGFSKTESNEYYQFYDLDNFRVFLGIKVTQSVFVTWKDCQIEDSVNNLSVHQLQNLYFALTGQELELKEL